MTERFSETADGEATDFCGRRHVASHQRGRDREHVGVVVKTEAGIIGRKQRRPIDLQRQQIVDRR